jgi:hypothetical protein
MIDFDTRPSERRGFFHKKLLKAALSFVPGGSTAAQVVGAISGIGGTSRARPSKFSDEELAGTLVHLRHGHTGADTGHGWMTPQLVQAARSSVVSGPVPSGIPSGFAALPQGTGGCLPPLRRDPRTGDCRMFIGTQSGVDPTPVGDAVMGRFGPALVPGRKVIDEKTCLRGMVLGLDSLCYNSKGPGRISNKNRLWPKGAKPLGSPEQTRALRISAQFGRQFKTTQERLQKLGFVPKPAPRRRQSKQKQLTAGKQITVIDTE